MNLILASGSPRRRDILSDAGYVFTIQPSPAEESASASLGPARMCEENALLKARAIAQLHPNATVIGADTLVFLDNQPLGKPKSTEEARSMLLSLSGRMNIVCTGVSIISPEKEQIFSVQSQVYFKKLTDETIQEYMEKVDVMDKAGAYAVQSERDLIIQRVEGDLENVIGLPLEMVIEKLGEIGLQPKT